MKNILVLGWYGTETLGDRAILDGIFQIMGNYHTYKLTFDLILLLQLR